MSKAKFNNLPYRRCAGIALVNDKGQVFVGERIGRPDAWQMPQGGIDEGETARKAALRELLEEVGTDKAEIVASSKRWLHYDLPDELLGVAWKGKYRGQTQKWFLMRFTGSNRDINVATEHPEFQTWKWMRFAHLPKVIVPFKRAIYEQVLEEFGPLVVKLKKKPAKRK